MKIHRFAVILFLTLITVACGQTAPVVTSVTLVQYNVGVFDKYEESGFEAIASAVMEMGADAVSLNEVDSCALRTGSVDQISVFAEELGDWNKYYASAMPFNGGAYGVGIVSSPKLKVVRTDKVSLPKLNGREPRALAVVEYEEFIYASTHLDLTEESQLGQVAAINDYIDSVYPGDGKPVFLAGDFNCRPEGSTIQLVKQSWNQLTPDSFSFPSHAPDRCIDYIFVRPRGRKITVRSAEVPVNLQTADLATASDHLPVVLSVIIEK